MALRTVLAENLRRLRKDRGWSQEAFADKAEIDRTYVSAIERQIYAVTIDVLERLAEALDVEPTELLRVPASMVTTIDITVTIPSSKGRRQPSKSERGK